MKSLSGIRYICMFAMDRIYVRTKSGQEIAHANCLFATGFLYGVAFGCR